MNLHIGSRSKSGLVIERWFHPGGDTNFINGAWLVREGETETVNRPGSDQHGWPIGTIAPVWMLVRMEWEGDAATPVDAAAGATVDDSGIRDGVEGRE